MSIFDKLKSTAKQAVNTAAQSVGNKRETFTFASLPESLAQMQALPEASLDTPFKTAALTVLALCAYAADKNIGTEMLNRLRGPRPLNGQDISFLNDRFRDGKLCRVKAVACVCADIVVDAQNLRGKLLRGGVKKRLKLLTDSFCDSHAERRQTAGDGMDAVKAVWILKRSRNTNCAGF